MRPTAERCDEPETEPEQEQGRHGGRGVPGTKGRERDFGGQPQVLAGMHVGGEKTFFS